MKILVSMLMLLTFNSCMLKDEKVKKRGKPHFDFPGRSCIEIQDVPVEVFKKK